MILGVEGALVDECFVGEWVLGEGVSDEWVLGEWTLEEWVSEEKRERIDGQAGEKGSGEVRNDHWPMHG